jgi:hypothetical protein
MLSSLPSEPESAEQAVATRKLLQSTSDTATVVQVQMTGSNANTTAEIAQELGTVVANNALQAGSVTAHVICQQLKT